MCEKDFLNLIDDTSNFGRLYSKICEILKQRNVPASRLPDRRHFMSRILSCLDENKLEFWIKKYAELECIGIEEIETEEDNNQIEEI